MPLFGEYSQGGPQELYSERLRLYAELERKRASRVLLYFTGDRPQLETRIAAEVLDLFLHHLDAMGDGERISLCLYTRGGDTLASWSIVNLIRQFCKTFEVIVPAKAHSGGTLICLGAERIVMTKQATLGPIDPSVNTPLNPQIPGAPAGATFPVSVEAITGFLDFARQSLGKDADLTQALLRLAQTVDPLVLGEAFRARGQIRMLAEKLLRNQVSDEARLKKILEFLCSESGSHDYTINRAEAQQTLGLSVEKPDQPLYELVKMLYDNIANELELRTPYDPAVVLGTQNQVAYRFKRALIESIKGGSDAFISEGELSKQVIQQGAGLVEAIHDRRSTDGWRHEDAPTASIA